VEMGPLLKEIALIEREESKPKAAQAKQKASDDAEVLGRKRRR